MASRGVLGGVLQVEIEAGRHLQAVAEQRLGTEAILDLLAHVGDEVWRLARAEGRGRLELQLRAYGRVVLRRGDGAGAQHLLEHVLLALLGRRHVGVRVVVRRRLRQAGQESRLGQGKLARGLGEVGLRGGLDPVGAVAERDLVQIHLEDLVLGVAARELHGQEGFFDLALGGLFGPQKGVLDELLGDGRRAALGRAGADPLVGGAQHGAGIEAGIVEERGVLGGNGGRAHDGRHLGDGHQRATPAGRVVELLQQGSIAIEDARGLEALAARQRARVGQVARVVGVDAHDGREGERGQEDEEREAGQQQAHSGCGSRSKSCERAIISRMGQPDVAATSFVHPTAEVSPEATLGAGCKVWRQAHIRERATIGASSIIGAGVYVGADVRVGARCKVQNNALLYEGVTLEDGVFVGPQVCFTNDLLPRAVNPDLTLKSADDWEVTPTLVRRARRSGRRAWSSRV